MTCDNRSVRRISALLISLLVWTVAAPSRAQTHRAIHEAVRVTGADDCLHHEAVVERLRRWLGTDTVADRIDVTLDVPLNAFEISRADGTSRRALGALPGACEDRLDAVTLAMALAIDHTLAERLGLDEAGDGSGQREAPHNHDGDRPDAEEDAPLHPSPVEPSPLASMEPKAADEPELEAAAEATADAGAPREAEAPAEPEGPPSTGDVPPPEHQARAGAYIEVGAALHVVPGWRTAVAGGVVVRFATGLSARLGGLWMSEGSAALGSGTARYRLWAGRADLCGEHPLGPLALGGCAGMGVGRLTIAGEGFEMDRTARQLWVAAIGRASASYVAGPARVGLAADLFAPVLRRRAHVEDRVGDVLHDRSLAPVATVLWLTAAMTLR